MAMESLSRQWGRIQFVKSWFAFGRGASEGVYPQRYSTERATKPQGKPAFARSVAPLLLMVCLAATARSAEKLIEIGVAAIDITPDYPVRLSGFGNRRAESESVTQKIWAKALAFADAKEGPAILITTDNLCVPDEITRQVAQRLEQQAGLKLERLAITATHTHTAPMLTDVAPTLFGMVIPPEHQAKIDQYTRQFVDKLEEVALEAVKQIRPSRAFWGIGTADFAINRRTQGGPVDHDLPALVIRDPKGKVRAIYFSYACHCVTLRDNKISGDWAGFAQEAVQKLFPEAIALASVGCGADANPRSGMAEDSLAACAKQGEVVANEIKRLVSENLREIQAGPTVRYRRVDLPFDTSRTRGEWEERAKSADQAVAYHARLNLGRLDRGEKLPTQMTYPIQTWLFGENLALIFLPGETVVDYALRLKREFDRKRLWVNGYSNEGRCYIPSERVLQEGGYEGGHAMIYYDRPQRFAPGVEEKIFNVLYSQLPDSFRAAKGTEGTRPLSTTESLRSIHTKPGLEIELVAAEPLIMDPVAIDWGRDGRLWVCEMHDYPAGLDQNWQPGGRVKFLEDTNGDGSYDKATLFADGIPFPTGLTAWGSGIFICAAPDILYAEDTNGDGVADDIRKVFSGFATDNFQARVNSLQLGLDNWIHGANGLLGGSITPYPAHFPGARPPATVTGPAVINIRNRDFRFSPFTAEFETATGLSQQGRVRDDWGNWFGCDNSQLLLHFPVSENYVRRNPHVAAPQTLLNLTGRDQGNRLFPRSRLLERFNDLSQANRTTSAGGLGIYRDTLLGEEYFGNAFTAEAVHNLVHREVISFKEGSVSSARASDERESEFLASEDNWFRPVQIRTGPDGALYVVDMYRFLIEHPRWIPAARLAQIDIRAGSDKGRIYRVRAAHKPLRLVPDLTKMSGSELAAALNSPNGAERDRVHIELLIRQDPTAVRGLERLLTTASLPQVRLQALCALDAMGGVNERLLGQALKDSSPEVRCQALRLAEPMLRQNAASAVAGSVLALMIDDSKLVAQQLALTLGEWGAPGAGHALAALAKKFVAEENMRARVLTSARPHCAPLLEAILTLPPNTPGRNDWVYPLVATAAGSEDEKLLARALALLSSFETRDVDQFAALVPVLDALERRNTTWRAFFSRHADLRGLEARFVRLFQAASRVAADLNAPEGDRVAALTLVGRTGNSSEELDLLCRLATQAHPVKVRNAALSTVRRHRDPEVASRLLSFWRTSSPVVRHEIAAILLSRADWAIKLLAAVRQGTVQGNEISPADRQRALQSSNDQVRQFATELLGQTPTSDRGEVLRQYEVVASLPGSAAKGAEVFAENCASCHAFGGVGAEVGPDLAPLRDKDANYWVKSILDPNAVVEPRFVTYDLDLKDQRSLTGIIKSETTTSLVLLMGGGVAETVLTGDLQEIRASRLSLMPEGLERAIPPAEMANLIAFLKNAAPGAKEPDSKRGAPELVLRDPASVARLVLDFKQPDALRETAISSNPQYAADLIAEMTRNLAPGTPEEYVRIPWIWRVAIAAGKRNDSEQLRRILTVTLPNKDEPLRDWQAVVIGGGIINGVSQRGQWPGARLLQIVRTDPDLEALWARALDLAATMTDDPKVPSGTRYDALRMLGVQPWEKRGPQLARYLTETNSELQMGAVSGLGDVDSPEATRALITAFSRFPKQNRGLAIAALLRTPARSGALLEAIATKQIGAHELSAEQVSQLQSTTNGVVRDKAKALLRPSL